MSQVDEKLLATLEAHDAARRKRQSDYHAKLLLGVGVFGAVVIALAWFVIPALG